MKCIRFVLYLILLSQTHQKTGHISSDQYQGGTNEDPTRTGEHDVVAVALTRSSCALRAYPRLHVFLISVSIPSSSVSPSWAHRTHRHRRHGRVSSAHQPHTMRQRSQKIPASPHATQRTRQGAACDSVVRDQARDVPFRTTRTTKNDNVPSDKEEGNHPVAHIDKRHFRNRDSYTIVRVAASGFEESPLVGLRGHRLNQA